MSEFWTPFEPATLVPKTEAEIRALAKGLAVTDQEVRAAIRDQSGTAIFKNNLFQVAIKTRVFEPFGPVIHLSIKRLDKAPVRDWRHLQRIKNELCGDESEAVELYPAESRLADVANQYHLWVLPNQARFPFGFSTRLVGDESSGGAVQRPRGIK